MSYVESIGVAILSSTENTIILIKFRVSTLGTKVGLVYILLKVKKNYVNLIEAA